MDYYNVPRRLLRGARQLVYPRPLPVLRSGAGQCAHMPGLRRRTGRTAQEAGHAAGCFPALSGQAGRVRRRPSGMRAVYGGAFCTPNITPHHGQQWKWASGWQSWPLAVRCECRVQNCCRNWWKACPLDMTASFLCRHPAPARGYNVPQLMALPLTRALGVPLYPEALGRTRAKQHQAGLPFEQRMANVAGAFRVTDPDRIEGRKVLLVDDVITTGATAAACAQALLSAGAESVFAVAVATVEFPPIAQPTLPLQEDADEEI